MLRNFCVISLLLFHWVISTPAYSASYVAYAGVNLVKNIQVSEQQALNFGQISNLNGSCQMLQDGSLVASGAQTCNQTQNPGIFSISGSLDQAISISVSQGATIPGVEFTPALVGSSNQQLTGGSTTIAVIGTLAINNAQQGNKAIPYIVTVNYQ